MKKTDEYLFDREILITIEHYDKINKNILFDFLDDKYYNRFLETFNLQDLQKDDASMLLFYNFSVSKKLQLGVYYNLSSLTSKFLFLTEQEDDSNIILLRIDLKGEDLRNLIVTSKISAEYILENLDNGVRNGMSTDDLIPSFPGSPSKKELIIKCVGQGSWNEFSLNDEIKVVYDIGTSYLNDKTTVKKLMALRDVDYQKSKPIVVLSHWDVDHYHMLLVAEDETIRSIKVFLYRSSIPNKTSKRLIDRFKVLNPAALFPVDQERPISGNTSNALKKIFGKKNGFFIFNGSKNKDRNKSGILLALKTASQVIIFGADFYYEQINTYVLPHFHYQHDHYLVVPHHGGEAGKFIYENLYSSCKDAIISVGSKYSYNHPLYEVKEELRRKKFKIVNFKLEHPPHQYVLKLY